MSGRIGTCINCGETDMGIYTMDVTRGWHGDKFDFNVEICEECVTSITKNWNLPDSMADKVYVFSRKGEELPPEFYNKPDERVK